MIFGRRHSARGYNSQESVLISVRSVEVALTLIWPLSARIFEPGRTDDEWDIIPVCHLPILSLY